MSVDVQLVKKVSLNLYYLVLALTCYTTLLLNAVEKLTDCLLLCDKKKLFIQNKNRHFLFLFICL